MLARGFKGRTRRRLLKFYLHNRAPKHWLGDAMRARRMRNRIRKRAAGLRAFRHNAYTGAARLTSGLLSRRAGRA